MSKSGNLVVSSMKGLQNLVTVNNRWCGVACLVVFFFFFFISVSFLVINSQLSTLICTYSLPRFLRSLLYIYNQFQARNWSVKKRMSSLRPEEFCVVQASTSQTSVFDPVSSPSTNNTNNSEKKSNETALILMRHGESLWNEKNLFTGCVDVPLTKKGVEEAIEAGKRISNIPVDMIYTSALIRAQMTAMLAMTQHRRRKVPIIIHNESEQARTWSEIFSEDTKKQSIPVIAAWQLNERMYGELQGLNKQETADRYGKEQVHEWRRSYDIPPPNGESLEMCAERAVAYFKDQIEPQLLSGKNVMIAAHGIH
ncbi:2,3-bisphosphoglycerate-dependent phosphoglycerate mutase [Quercus suber]|uniref:phosphoglycerate mutase (2,3-diphosphoglycerate-dependent) n=1 Tax=Quercus suber TaxID=58331 RepID=A0AAW0KZT5_QUESU